MSRSQGILGVVRWRLIDLCQWFWHTFELRIAKPTLSREVWSLCYRKLSARPRHHAQAEGAIGAFKQVLILNTSMYLDSGPTERSCVYNCVHHDREASLDVLANDAFGLRAVPCR